jgi:hypothetical protein
MRARGCRFQIVNWLGDAYDHRAGRPRNSVIDQSKKIRSFQKEKKNHAPVGIRKLGLNFDVCRAGLWNRYTSTGGFAFVPVS